ncbi:MAG: amino acid ABC transporter permease [Alphaproteobacteria bacterium]|nr:amino acid ABC transporter permease [Alphaproteobacteria bacterium]
MEGRRPAISVLEWLRVNLFSSVGDTALTLGGALIVWFLLVPALDWAFVRAVWTGDDRTACIVKDAGACWPYIGARMGQIVYGFYDVAQRWRVDLIYALGALGLLWLTLPFMPYKRVAGVLMLSAYPVLAYVLLTGGMFGIDPVPTQRWGGLLLTLIVSATGIIVSMPVGILLALGRQSDMPVFRWTCTAFIELVRGVPLITFLFMASNMLPLFLPEGAAVDKLLRALIAVALFSSAYMAEVVRGGLQAIPRGQYEASKALGLSYWPMMGLIILPQALRIVIPGIVNSFIALFKDTSLVSIIGFFDLLGIIQSGNSDPNWAAPNTAFTGFVFAGAVYWAFCFSMSRYSQAMERRLGAGTKRGQ